MAVEKSGGLCGNFLGSCITTTTAPIDYSCKNPYYYLLYEVVGLSAPGIGSRKSTIAEVLDRVLDKGIFIQGECEMCCPDCNNIHIIASVETANKILFGKNVNNFGNGLVCEEIDTNRNCGQSPAKFEGVVGCGTISCCNGFKEGFDKMMCLAELTTAVNGFGSSAAEVLDRILDKGVVEYGTIQGQSQLENLVKWVSEANYWTEIAPSSYAEVFDRILDKGIVIWCDPETSGFGISSVETFIKSLPCREGGTDLDYPFEGFPCCINVKASIETYQKYLTASDCPTEDLPA